MKKARYVYIIIIIGLSLAVVGLESYVRSVIEKNNDKLIEMQNQIFELREMNQDLERRMRNRLYLRLNGL